MTEKNVTIVTGCRDWADGETVKTLLSKRMLAGGPALLFHGACQTGADMFAEQWYEESRDIARITRCAFPANWAAYGRAAGPKRNEEMLHAARKEVRYGGTIVCLAFWDGRSPGTLDCIKCAVTLGIPVRVVPKASVV
jgi:hypothetical protein